MMSRAGTINNQCCGKKDGWRRGGQRGGAELGWDNNDQ